MLVVVIVISVLSIIVSLVHLSSIFYKYYKSASTYESLRKLVEDDTSPKESKFNELKKINGDYVGWIKIEDTNIDYPVVKGTDNNFYLSHNFYKATDQSGCIFMDYLNSGTDLDKNIILYGHNMKDKSMFANLKSYLSKDFLNKHKLITFEFLDKKYEYEVFSAYTTTDPAWLKVDFDRQDSFSKYLSVISKKSGNEGTFDSKMAKILTLSTCTSRIDNERVVVHALIKSKGGD